jgi:hypothetical protein
MNDHDLLHRLAWRVSAMRRYQLSAQQPGERVRPDVLAQVEAEVDELLELYFLPALPELPAIPPALYVPGPELFELPELPELPEGSAP